MNLQNKLDKRQNFTKKKIINIYIYINIKKEQTDNSYEDDYEVEEKIDMVEDHT